jgi:para-aminobenzoate synthetase/4-amino-4-deoxychorismate lyase
VTVAGGLGRHKWADRRLLDALAASVPGEPLLCDLDGVVLESARANVFIVEPGPRVVTPPDDGRILPGVTRGAVLALARDLGYEARAEPIDLERLKRAQEMFVTGALSGIEPAQLAGVTGVHGETTATLARAWASARAPSGADAARDAEPALERGSPV